MAESLEDAMRRAEQAQATRRRGRRGPVASRRGALAAEPAPPAGPAPDAEPPDWDAAARTKLTVPLPFALDDRLSDLARRSARGAGVRVRKPSKAEIIEMLVWELGDDVDLPAFVGRLEAFRAATGRRGSGQRRGG